MDEYLLKKVIHWSFYLEDISTTLSKTLHLSRYRVWETHTMNSKTYKLAQRMELVKSWEYKE